MGKGLGFCRADTQIDLRRIGSGTRKGEGFYRRRFVLPKLPSSELGRCGGGFMIKNSRF